MIMKCTDIQINIDNYLDRQLSLIEKIAFEEHVADCDECASHLKQARDILTKLQNLAVPENSFNFDKRIFSEVRKQYKEHKQPQHGFGFATGFATAAVASLAIWFVSATYLPIQQVEHPQIISMTMNQSQTVRLLFDSDIDIQQAELKIDLPGNMHLEGYSGRNSLTWQTSLQKGQNVLALPVIATRQGKGELVAQLSYEDTVKTFSVVLKASLDGVLKYQLKEVKPV